MRTIAGEAEVSIRTADVRLAVLWKDLRLISEQAPPTNRFPRTWDLDLGLIDLLIPPACAKCAGRKRGGDIQPDEMTIEAGGRVTVSWLPCSVCGGPSVSDRQYVATQTPTSRGRRNDEVGSQDSGGDPQDLVVESQVLKSDPQDLPFGSQHVADDPLEPQKNVRNSGERTNGKNSALPPNNEKDNEEHPPLPPDEVAALSEWQRPFVLKTIERLAHYWLDSNGLLHRAGERERAISGIVGLCESEVDITMGPWSRDDIVAVLERLVPIHETTYAEALDIATQLLPACDSPKQLLERVIERIAEDVDCDVERVRQSEPVCRASHVAWMRRVVRAAQQLSLGSERAPSLSPSTLRKGA